MKGEESPLTLVPDVLPELTAARLARGINALQARVSDPDVHEQLGALQLLLTTLDDNRPGGRGTTGSELGAGADHAPPEVLGSSPDTGPEIAACLAGWLAAQGVSAQVLARGKATVGLSQETWLVDVESGGEGARPLVLRLPTPASGAHAIMTQHAALQAVAGSEVPAPTIVWFDRSEQNPFGRPFLVMDRLPGTAPVGWHELAEPQRTQLAREAIDVLVKLHAIDVAQTTLGDIRPAPTVVLGGLREIFERLAPLPAVVTEALDWLAQNEPEPSGPPVIVHADYRMGNLLVDDGHISGVLDWEMAAPGDRLTDLAWCFIPVFEAAGVDEQMLVDRYAHGAGLAVDPSALHWHRVFGLTRLAFYHLAGPRAFDAGRSDDLRLAALRLRLPVTLQRLMAALEQS